MRVYSVAGHGTGQSLIAMSIFEMDDEKRVLILDDEKPFADYVQKVAERQGYLSRAATKAREFKNLFHEFDPTVVILDIVMPDTDGIEMAKWLESSGYKGRLLFVTGYNPYFADWATELNLFSNFAEVNSMTKPASSDKLKSYLH